MNAPPLAYSMTGAAEASGLSKSYLDRAIHAGRLRVKYSGQDADGNPVGNRVILATELQRFLDGLVDG